MSAFNVPAATIGEVECTATASTCGPTTLVVTDDGPSAFTTRSEREPVPFSSAISPGRPPTRARVRCQIALERSALADLDPEVARRQQLVEHDLRLCRGRLGDAGEIGALGDRRGLRRRVVEPEGGRRLVLLRRARDEPDGDEHRGQRHARGRASGDGGTCRDTGCTSAGAPTRTGGTDPRRPADPSDPWTPATSSYPLHGRRDRSSCAPPSEPRVHLHDHPSCREQERTRSLGGETRVGRAAIAVQMLAHSSSRRTVLRSPERGATCVCSFVLN